MNASIHGIGLSVPKHRVTQEAAAEFALANCIATGAHRMLAMRIYENSGVDSRHSVLLDSSSNGEPARQSYYAAPEPSRPDGPSTAQRMDAYRVNASELAERAARQALDESGVDADQITHLVTVSCSGFYAPGFDVDLINNLPLGRETSRTHIGFMGCHGALNGLRVARSYVNADPTAKVLLVAVELCTLHYQYNWTPGRIVSNSLFADGAAAAVIAAPEGGNDERVLADDYSIVVPACEDAMTWSIGDHGFEMTLSAEVPSLLEGHLRPAIEQWLARHDLTVEDVDSWAIHPGGPRILQAAQEALGLPENALDTSHEVLRRYGNMSSPTTLFVLDELARSRGSDTTVAMGFGPGLTIEAALMQ